MKRERRKEKNVKRRPKSAPLAGSKPRKAAWKRTNYAWPVVIFKYWPAELVINTAIEGLACHFYLTSCTSNSFWILFKVETFKKIINVPYKELISRIRKFLSLKTTEILVHAFVSSKLDHCNYLLHNVPKYVVKKFQCVQNAAARLITCFHKYDHITSILSDLYWLPVSERIKCKILLLTFKVLHQQSPTYIQDLVTRYSPSRTLRSSSTLRLNPVNVNLKSYGSKAFAVSAPDL